MISILTEFHSSLSQTVEKTALIFHIPTIIFPLSQGSRKSEPPTTFCTKATPPELHTEHCHLLVALVIQLSWLLFFLFDFFLLLLLLFCFGFLIIFSFSCFHITTSIQSMARDKSKYQLLPALCPEGKDFCANSPPPPDLEAHCRSGWDYDQPQYEHPNQ